MQRVIAVIGAKGFVGSALCREIGQRKDLQLIPVCRGDDLKILIKKADIIIHAANPAKRFFAEKDPGADFAESVDKTFMVKQSAKGKKIILISTVSARLQLNTVYGRHRRACEMIIEDEQNLIVRLGPMFGEGKEVGALHDILNNRPCFVNEKTRYAYVDVAYNARKIVNLFDEQGMAELGARNAVSLAELRDAAGSASTFTGPDDTQIPLTVQSDAPDAREVITFALNLKKVSP